MRDCTAKASQEQQPWASKMQDFLFDLHEACQQWRLLHQPSVPPIERVGWVARYFEILAAGSAAQHPSPASPMKKAKAGTNKARPRNGTGALLEGADHALARLYDLCIPFMNNQAERDLSMAKVQQKISGSFRSATGATALYRIRSYLSPM